MAQQLVYTSFLVPDYDEAIRFFTLGLRWQLREDTPMSPTKRWVVVAPDGSPGGALLLARAATPEQQAMVGRQGAGRVWLFVHTSSFDDDIERLPRHGARLTEAPRHEPYGRVLVFEDPWGNRWDLIEPKVMLSP
jgi:predicted enzyme related to lactoylglutathione lyase